MCALQIFGGSCSHTQWKNASPSSPSRRNWHSYSVLENRAWLMSGPCHRVAAWASVQHYLYCIISKISFGSQRNIPQALADVRLCLSCSPLLHCLWEAWFGLTVTCYKESRKGQRCLEIIKVGKTTLCPLKCFSSVSQTFRRILRSSISHFITQRVFPDSHLVYVLQHLGAFLLEAYQASVWCSENLKYITLLSRGG